MMLQIKTNDLIACLLISLLRQLKNVVVGTVVYILEQSPKEKRDILQFNYLIIAKFFTA